MPGPARRPVVSFHGFFHCSTSPIFHCDITEPAGVEGMMTAVVQRFGKLDVLYNNAGSSHGVFGPLHTLDVDGYVVT
jgi:NAD(P)-dependent dehydrogenase (short-subunit alcohol dehydrogenase family)